MSTKAFMICFFITFGYILHESKSLYMGESHVRMKWKMIVLNRELVMESTRNVERVQHFRKVYQQSKTWPIGQLLYVIRSKFARMIRLYTLSIQNLDKYGHNQHITHLSEIQRLSMDIYAMAEILEESEERDRRKKQEEKEEREYQKKYGNHPSSNKNSLRSATKHIPKFVPKKHASRDTNKVNNRGSKSNADPLQFYDGGFETDIN